MMNTGGRGQASRSSRTSRGSFEADEDSSRRRTPYQTQKQVSRHTSTVSHSARRRHRSASPAYSREVETNVAVTPRKSIYAVEGEEEDNTVHETRRPESVRNSQEQVLYPSTGGSTGYTTQARTPTTLSTSVGRHTNHNSTTVRRSRHTSMQSDTSGKSENAKSSSESSRLKSIISMLQVSSVLCLSLHIRTQHMGIYTITER